MRELVEEEMKTVFAKLANYTGNSLKNLIAPLDDSPNADRYVFRLQNQRCYYVLESLVNLATSVKRDQLLSIGTCLGMCGLIYSAWWKEGRKERDKGWEGEASADFWFVLQESSLRRASFGCISLHFVSGIFFLFGGERLYICIFEEMYGARV